MEEGGNGRRAFHGVRQPDVERDLRRLARGADEQQQGDQGQRAEPGGLDGHRAGRVGDGGHLRQEQEERRAAMLQMLAALTDPYADSIVSIIVDSRDAAYGVVVDDEGHVLTKASELGTGARRIDVLLGDGLSVPGKRLAVDREVGLISQAVSASGASAQKVSKDEFRDRGRELSDILTTLRQVLTRDAINKLES